MVLLLVQCKNEPAETETQPGLALEYLDTTVNPSQDFYQFVNGKWLDNTEIPADRGRWGSFDELRKNTDENVLKILEKAGESDFSQAGSDQRKAATFFNTAMDTAQINKIGMQPLKPFIEQIANVNSTQTLQKYLADTEPYGGGGFFSFSVFPDLQNSNINAAYVNPGTLGLPERDYYLKDDERSLEIQERYRAHIERMLSFLEIDPEQAAQKAESIYALEKRMAEHMLSKEVKRNISLLYNKRSIDQLEQHAPSVDWVQYLNDLGVADLDSIIVTEPKFMEALDEILNDVPSDQWQDYLTWTALNTSASYLQQDIEEANFEFFGKELQGVEEMRPRWERVLGTTNGVIGEALGQLYVDAYFPPEAKAVAKDLVNNLLVAFGERIGQLDWMSAETKDKALKKLESFNVKIGYPDEWKDYADLEVKSSEEGGSYFENLLEATKYNFYDDLDKIGKVVDKTEWFMSPQVVNAYYNPLFNEIVFPAAILQPPFYNYKADAAINYGGIGAVIGHEISHGFDDMGSRFDAGGNMINWWTDADREKFEALNQKLIDQFDNYKPFPDLAVNGEFTLGENIGDLGGLNVALDGLKMHWDEHGKPEPIDGFSADQRFFMSWATIWRTKMRDEAMRTQIKTDPHSPGLYRAIGAPSNMTAFYDAFDIEEGDPLYRPEEERVKIW